MDDFGNDFTWYDDLSGAWDTGGDSGVDMGVDPNFEFPTADQGTSSGGEGSTPLPAESAGNTDPLKIFSSLAGYGLTAAKTYNDIKLARSQQVASAAIARDRLAASQAATQADLRAKTAQSNADAQVAQLKAQAQVAAQKARTLLADPRTWVVLGIGAIAAFKLLGGRRGLA